ncbi:MAG: tetratricopeptide repeat protein [Cyanobacteriota bacterium]|nr:tetratricopeptide repeat protein [Cyanobacteriota bacterium]
MFAAAALVAGLCLGGGLWIGRQQGSAGGGGGSRQGLEQQLGALQQQNTGGEATPASQQRQLELLIALERKSEAAALLEQLADREPQRWGLRLLLAELRRDLGDRPGAGRELRQLLNQRPDQIEGLQLLTLVLLEQGQGQEARLRVQSSFDRLSKAPAKPEALGVGLLLAELLDKQGSPGQAEAVLVKLATAFPTDRRPLLARALLLQQRGQVKAAQTLLAQAQALKPGQRDPKLDRVATAWGLAGLKGPSVRPPAPVSPPAPGNP